jgi:hypothetical protein
MNKLKHAKFYILIIIIFVLFFNCNEKINNPGNDLVFPDSKVSFVRHVQPLFNYKCSITGCHDDDPQNTRLSLTSYYEATKYPGIIVSGLPDNSVLIQRLDGRLQPRMPLYRDTLSKNQYNGLRTWIKEGALNN